MTEGLDRLITRIREVSSKLDRPTIALLGGGSASGKTGEVAAKVVDAFAPNSSLRSADDYYKGIAFMQTYLADGEPLNFDDPRASDIPGVAQDIISTIQSLPIKRRFYSFETGEPFEKSPPEMIEPAKVVVVEGLFALDDRIAHLGDVRAFVDSGLHGRLLRRLLRDVHRTGQTPEDILDYFSQMVHPMHEQYVQTTIKNAEPDLILKNEYEPKIESHRSGMYENQIKFPANLTHEQLRKIGSERLARVHQIDRLYNPHDRDLSQSGEMVRIRQEIGYEDDSWILTYKGPQTENLPHRQRPKFEFELPRKVAERFVAMYGKEVMVIAKERILYRLGRSLFSLDQVTKGLGNQEKPLGTFIEFRLEDNEQIPESVLSKLNLSPEAALTTSYAEL